MRIATPSSLEEARELWQSGETLVLLPPHKHAERDLLLRELPEKIPPSTRLIAFTSGSSGSPKAVLHGKDSLEASALQLRKKFSSAKRIACGLPLWGMASFELHVIFPGTEKEVLPMPEGFLSFLLELKEENAPDLLVLNPVLLNLLMDSGVALPSRTEVTTLTAPLLKNQKSRFKELFGRDMHEMYGMSEAAGPILYEGESLGAKLSLAEDGELLIDGPQLFSGYGSKGVFQPVTRPFHTGDVFERTEDGRFRFLSRKKELINVGGRKLAPLFVEELIRQIPGVRDCLAFAIDDPTYGERVGALLILKTGTSREDVEKRMAEHLSMDVRPAEWREVDYLPRLRNSKADRITALKILKS